MRLVKIYRDRVTIRTDESELKDVRVNDLLTVGDKKDTLAVMVTGITDNETESPLPVIGEDDFIGMELQESAGSEKNIDCTIIGSVYKGKYNKAIRQYPTTDITVHKATEDDLRALLVDADNSSFVLGKYGDYYEKISFEDIEEIGKHHPFYNGNDDDPAFTTYEYFFYYFFSWYHKR